MSQSQAKLHRQIASAGDLQGVVRTMKAMAASNIGQYEQAVKALSDYDHTVLLGLGLCFRSLLGFAPEPLPPRPDSAKVGAIVFGSDQGLVGRFNDVIVEHAVEFLAALPGTPQVWAVGERVQARLVAAGLAVVGQYALPSSVEAIAQLVGQIQLDGDAYRQSQSQSHGDQPVYVFHNRPQTGSLYKPVSQRLLPLDIAWEQRLRGQPWPTSLLPELMGDGTTTLRALMSEHLFISLFRACAESLASENASRLAAMERADKNIRELLERLNNTLHRQRQGAIDEELFDLISGYEALSAK